MVEKGNLKHKQRYNNQELKRKDKIIEKKNKKHKNTKRRKKNKTKNWQKLGKD